MQLSLYCGQSFGTSIILPCGKSTVLKKSESNYSKEVLEGKYTTWNSVFDN